MFYLIFYMVQPTNTNKFIPRHSGGRSVGRSVISRDPNEHLPTTQNRNILQRSVELYEDDKLTHSFSIVGTTTETTTMNILDAGVQTHTHMCILALRL